MKFVFQKKLEKFKSHAYRVSQFKWGIKCLARILIVSHLTYGCG